MTDHRIDTSTTFGYRVLKAEVGVRVYGLDLMFGVYFIIRWTNNSTPTVVWMYCYGADALSKGDIYTPVHVEPLDEWPESQLEGLANKVIDHYKSGHYDTTALWSTCIPEMNVWPFDFVPNRLEGVNHD